VAKDDGNDPFAPRDATVMRPRPGAGKRGAADAGTPGAAPGARSARRESADGVSGDLRDFMNSGLNPLLQAASPLLILAGKLRGMLSNPDVGALRRQVLEEIRRFEDRSNASGVASGVISAARYALCATLDEAVLSTPWGGQSEWAGQTLLVTLHRETWGGEKFFEMLDGILADPARHIDLIELQYVCLALGFAGKYQVQERGQSRLADIQSDLARRIGSFRGKWPEELSLQWRGVQDRRNPVLRYVPWWVFAAAGLLIVTVTFVVLRERLATLSAPISEQIAALGSIPPVSSVPVASTAGLRLRQLLADDEARGVLNIEEHGAQTKVILIAKDLFASGSATVNPAYYDSLRRIARALNEVPGRAFVIGHTDDQPLRSFKFENNVELSRARAVNVTEILKLAIDNPGRLSAEGRGSSEPRYTPASLPENRARNRRVEIIHVSES
jgi:type VI secretion system protein ImpK